MALRAGPLSPPNPDVFEPARTVRWPSGNTLMTRSLLVVTRPPPGKIAAAVGVVTGRLARDRPQYPVPTTTRAIAAPAAANARVRRSERLREASHHRSRGSRRRT